MNQASQLAITVFVALAHASSTQGPKPAQVWLVVAASDSSAEAIARKAKNLASTFPPTGLIVRTNDCGDRKNVFAYAVPSVTAKEAEAVLGQVRARVKDAYVKRCDVRRRSLLENRVPAVDSSIAEIPDTVVNWDEEERVSATVPLADGRVLIIVRYFANQPNDPLEGRRERVLMPTGVGDALVLEDNCPELRAGVVRSGRLAFACAREQAGDQTLHTVILFGETNQRLGEIARCRSPRWSSADTVTCDRESVEANGKLRLAPQRVSIKSLK